MQVCSLKSAGWMHENRTIVSFSWKFHVLSVRHVPFSRVVSLSNFTISTSMGCTSSIFLHSPWEIRGCKFPRILVHRTKQIHERKNFVVTLPSSTRDRLEAARYREAGTTPEAQTSRNGINPLLLFTQKCRQTEIDDGEGAA